MVRPIGVGAVALLAAAAGQAATQPKVFDRTLVCTSGDGGARVSGQPTRLSDQTNGGVLLERQDAAALQRVLVHARLLTRPAPV